MRVFAKLVELRLSRYNGLYLLQPVLNRESYFRLRLLVLFAGAGESFGRHNDFGPNFVSVAVPEHNGGHEVERMLSVVQRGASPHVAKEAFVLPSDFCDSPETGRYARGSYAVLSPGGTKKFRRWPIENFIALSHRFRSVGLDTVFVGEEAERDILHGKETQLPDRAENVIGCTSLRDLSSIVSSAKIVVANDSGPMHLANALDVPVVGIFGSGDAVRTRPFLSEKARIVDSGPLGCKPCYAPDCKAAVCMEEITLDRVWKAAEDLME